MTMRPNDPKPQPQAGSQRMAAPPLGPPTVWDINTDNVKPTSWRALDRACWFFGALMVAIFLAAVAWGAETPETAQERAIVAAVVEEAMAEHWLNAPTSGAEAAELIEEAACAARVAYTETRGVLRGLAKKQRDAELFRLAETPIRRALDNGRTVCEEARRRAQFTPYRMEFDLSDKLALADYKQAARIAVIALTVKSGHIGPITNFWSPDGMPDGKPPYWADPEKGFRVVAVSGGFVYGRFEKVERA